MTAAPIPAERKFYVVIMVGILIAFGYGFAKTIFLRPLFPEVHSAHETYFYAVHGLIMFGWVALFATQISLMFVRRAAWHRRLGMVAFALVPVLAISSLYGALLAYHRPGGFTDLPRDGQLSFFGVLVSMILLFVVFATLALILRRKPQAHKRLMMLAAIVLLEGGVTRWPIPFIQNGGLTASGEVTALFLLPLVIWDLVTRRRLHPATALGVPAYVLYVFTRFTVFGAGPFLKLLGSIVGPPG